MNIMRRTDVFRFLVTILLFICFLTLVYSETYQFDIVSDKRRVDQRVRNQNGAQVGYMSYTPYKLHSAPSQSYVMPSFNISTTSNPNSEIYDIYGVAYKNESIPEDPFFVIPSTVSDYVSPGLLVVSFEVVSDGLYSPIFLRSDYLTVESCNEDGCFICNGTNSTCADCEGTLFGTKIIDSCGVCNGQNKDKDCDGVCFGPNPPNPETKICS